MHHNNLGLAPGSLVYTGKQKNVATTISLTSFAGEFLEEIKEIEVSDIKALLKPNHANWINIVGLSEVEKITQIGQLFEINNLLLEDALNVNQLPKTEELGDHLFVTLKMLSITDEPNTYQDEHISLILGDGYFISFQEKEGDVFDSVRNRIRNKYGKIRNRGNDYLLYALLDAIVDNYLLITKQFEEKLEALEIEVFSNTSDNISKRIIDLRKQLNRLGKFIKPTTSVTQNLLRSETELMFEEIDPFLSDLNDHSKRASDRITEQKEAISSYMELHLSLQGQRMNEIMKVLTIVAAIFIPLTFLAGIYGMNFSYMPELQYQWSYPILLSTMLILGIGLVFYFKKKNWL